ncbi:MAG: hypothetical protein H0U91_15005 [Rubrobacter sp.]|jgi:hypothetical protein|nr:hypothetical protein [Rubrobacter sp.]MBA3951184.1 hypothetical protein [Rubrobacter sp.]MDQ3361135.1 hypothetical protein [Actinomycetota bacterium]MDQ3376206.1 hypothetical protein [Actinomycetota bacterium]
MKKWIAGTFLAAGLVIFGSAAIAQDAAPQDPRQAQNVQQEDHSDGLEGCRFGGENSGGDAV